MKFSELFDPQNPEHVEAFIHLEKTGKLPGTFVMANASVEMNSNWHQVIKDKMVDAWIEFMLRFKHQEREKI